MNGEPDDRKRDLRARQARLGETVLVVEDDAGVRALAWRALAACGYEVLLVRSGSDALDMVRSGRQSISLIVTDQVLPDTSGLALAALIHKQLPDCPFLFIADEAATRMGPPASVPPRSAFIEKPFTPAELARKVRMMLDAPIA